MKKIFLAVGIFFFLSAALLSARLLKKIQFETTHPKRGEITEAVYGLGRVKSDQRFDVIVGVMSTVTGLYVKEGDEVKKNTPLIEFDHQARFKAPFNGTITLTRVRLGETALPQQASLRLEDLTTRYIELSLEQQDALRVRKNQVARVSFEALRGNVLQGRVSAVYSRGEEFVTRVEVEGLAPNILPGMTADVSVEIGNIKNALLIPLRSIENGLITLRRKGKWEKKKIEIGHIDGSWAEVLGNPLNLEDEIRVRPSNGP